MINQINQINQYFLWPNCSINCDFCIYRGFKKFNIEQQISSIERTINLINKHCAESSQSIGILIIGGELFDQALDDKLVFQKFIELINECLFQYKKNKINSLMLATSLIFDFEQNLYKIIKYIKKIGLFPILMINTSYDYDYRFKNQNNLDKWKINIDRLHKLGINVHTEMILSKTVILNFISGKFSKKAFENEYHTYIDFIEPSYTDFFNTKSNEVKEIPQFLPSRNDFIKFIEKCKQTNEIDIDTLFSKQIRAKNVYYVNQLQQPIEIIDRWKSGCRRFDDNGKIVKLYTYSDSDQSMIDDLEILKDSI